MTSTSNIGFTAICASLSAALFVSTGAASAQTGAVVDIELASQIDFRADAFRPCFDQLRCTVGNVTVHAERRTPNGLAWEPAKIYWDPVDGIGIQDGGQNDEIDFDERLFVTFETAQTVEKVWLSDLFRDEDGRYGSGETDRIEGVFEDAEAAAITLSLDGAAQTTVLIEADDRLPFTQFNEEVSLEFDEDGDLRRRIVIASENVRIVAPGVDGRGRIGPEQFTIGQIDPEKKSIFDGLETVEIDITSILEEFDQAEMFDFGTLNFDYIRSLTEDPAALNALRTTAETKRTTIDLSNGEVAWTFETPTPATQLEFIAPFDASNDYSVAGIILQ